MIAAIRYGVARGIFSNEAGLGTAGIAQAAGMSNDPVRSGLIGMMGTFFDTIVVCSMTGLAIVVSGAWESGKTGAELTQLAFQSAMPGIGDEVVAIALGIFALTTIFGWSYYGERCWQFLVGALDDQAVPRAVDRRGVLRRRHAPRPRLDDRRHAQCTDGRAEPDRAAGAVAGGRAADACRARQRAAVLTVRLAYN